MQNPHDQRPTVYDPRRVVVSAPESERRYPSDQFFTNTKGAVPRLCCRACPRTVVYDPAIVNIVDSLQASHKCGDGDGHWLD